jgi:protein SCO1/2
MTDPSTPTALEGQPDAPAGPPAGPPPQGRPRSAWRALAPIVVIVAIVVAFTLLVVVPKKPKAQLPGGVSEAATHGSFDGGTLTPVKPAPDTSLRNYLGQQVSISQYRGKALFVTFLYTHCPDVCPLIASNFHAAQVELGAGNAKVQMLAISVDPTGDTPATVAAFLRVHDMVGRMQYLIGSAAALGPVWAAWNVGSERDAGSPDLVDHSALVYGISATGDVTTIYPADFEPSELVHDAPLLESQ